jgi:SAM-dependent methyltransferase
VARPIERALMDGARFRDDARTYYDAKLRVHGATPAGMDWNSQESQELRFRQLARLWEGQPTAGVVDYGCGYAALASYVRAHGHAGTYCGYDVSPSMVAAAGQHVGALGECHVTADRGLVSPLDYAVASGVLNVKQGASDDAWKAYVHDTIADLASLGTRGFGFNVLTSYSDPEKRRPDLYYADPLDLFDHCQRTYSRFVALLHDYPLYEFTILVRR